MQFTVYCIIIYRKVNLNKSLIMPKSKKSHELTKGMSYDISRFEETLWAACGLRRNWKKW